jgi:hypothetical protein
MNDQPFKIPKLKVPVVLHTLPVNEIRGDIFLDFGEGESYTVHDLLHFFNSSPPFFPIRTSAHSILVSRKSIVWIEIPSLLKEFQEETSVMLAERRQVLIQTDQVEEMKATIVLDLPEEYGRTLDLLNQKERFIVVIRNDSMMILNLDHVTRIQELQQ